MGTFDLEILMKSNKDVKDGGDRDAFLSRVLGIFSEKIIRIWCRDKCSPYVDLGRPTIYESENEERGSTIDFCFEDKKKKMYLSEMKCEVQFQNYKFLTLNPSTDLVKRAKSKPALKRFLDVTKNPSQYKITIGRKLKQRVIAVDGGILVWGRVDEDKKEEIMSKYKFADILSLEDVVNDLIKWENKEFTSFIDKYAGWCNELFEGIKGNS